MPFEPYRFLNAIMIGDRPEGGEQRFWPDAGKIPAVSPWVYRRYELREWFL